MFCKTGYAQEPATHPDSAKIVTSDIRLFWDAYDSSTAEDRADVFQSDYFNRGSEGLKAFIKLRIKSAEDLAQVVNSHPRYYASARESILRITDYEATIRKAFHKLEALYPDAVYPNVYFVIGRMNSGGTTSAEGLLIGAEMFGRTPQMPVEELDNWHRAVLTPVENIPHIVAHELIHYQQHYTHKPKTLLERAIKEGIADYVAKLISGDTINPKMYQWGERHESDTWCRFKEEMFGEDISNWLYNGSATKNRPADLGYFMGYKIAEAYHKQADVNDTEVLRNLFTIPDFKTFLKESKYAQQFVCESNH
ncbi:MAG: DUF2268 domain-containing putative Zn-dependent protease [Balneolaceae bacterium]